MPVRSRVSPQVEPGVSSEATDSQDEAAPEYQAGPGPSSSSSRARKAPLKTLGKGRACIKCRSRKMRCDGKHPTCTPCQRQNRECIYEPERTRTQKLLDKIEALESRLTELQAGLPQVIVTKTRLSSTLSVEQTTSFLGLSEDLLHRDSIAFEELDLVGDWWAHDYPPPLIQKFLLNACIAHSRPRFYLHVRRFWNSLSETPDGPRPLSSLLHAMYLTGCRASDQPQLYAHEEYFLARARRLQADLLGDPTLPVLQWLQASSLIATYLLGRCRLLEARHELSGTIHLVMGCRLHKISSSLRSPFDDFRSPSDDGFYSSLLPPPRDNAELGERILLFWMVWYCDHMCALVSGVPPNLYLDTETETIWPRLMDEYENPRVFPPESSVSNLLGPKPEHPFDPPCSMYAVRCKALAVLTRVCLFATSSTPTYVRTPEFRTQFQEYHSVLSGFLERLPPVHYDPGPRDVDRPPSPVIGINLSIFTAHSIVLVAFIQLYSAVTMDGAGQKQVYDRRLSTTKRAMLLLRVYLASGIPAKKVPTVCGYMWFCIARVLAIHRRRLKETSPDVTQLEELQTDINTVLTTIGSMAAYYPLLRTQLDKLVAWLNGQAEEELYAAGPALLPAL